MAAVRIPKNGGVEVLEYKTNYPVPTLSPGQVLVRNSFAGVNYIDTYFRVGLYPAPSFPLGLGREAAGEVVAIEGSAPKGIEVGTKVVYMGTTTGAYAEYSAVPSENCIAIPEGVSEDVAAAVYLQGLTAWTLVRDAANVQSGQWTLVHAAAGGVGLLLVQMLSAVGAKVIATASTDEKLELAKSHGAGWGIKSSDDVVAKVKEITGGHGIDAIFDGVGKTTFDADLQMVAMAGWLISFGNAVSSHASISLENPH
jgi:NADPH2:quinone reductase